MVRHRARYEGSAASYAQYRPSYPDQLIRHLAGLIAGVPAAIGTVLDIGAGTGIFSRQLRDALPAETRLIAVEPGAAMRPQAVVDTPADTGIEYVDGAAEAVPCRAAAADAVVAATAAHWFDRPAFYSEARRVLQPGGVLAIVQYVRDEESCPLAAAVVQFIGEHGSRRAYMPPDFRAELVALAGFGGFEDFTLRRPIALEIEQFVGLALSSSHAAGVIERFGAAGARAAMRDLATPHLTGDGHVRFGYRFECLTVHRAP
jgi:SAM-dependent methyltransferase